MFHRLKQFALNLSLLALCMAIGAAPAYAHAAANHHEHGFYNVGTLDVQPLHRGEAQSGDWFIENLKPGESKQHAVQISNFSPQTKQLTVYVTDTTLNENKQYQVKKLEENPDYLGRWIHLPTQELELGPGESRIISVNFNLPENAGIGLHQGAVIVRETQQDKSLPLESISFEKGIRTYLNVVGPAITQGNLQSAALNPSLNNYNLKINTANTGTTDYYETYRLELRDLFGATHSASSLETFTRPQEIGTHAISVEKPVFGLYQAFLANAKNESYVQTVLLIPFWALVAIAAFALFTGWIRNLQLARQKIKISINKRELKQVTAFISMFLVVATTVFSTPTLINIAKSQLLTNEPAQSYEMTIKWGNFRSITIPNYYRKEWQGRLFFPNAKVSIKEIIHFERTDEAEITGSKSELVFNNLTGPDNDGIILRVEPLNNEIPIVRYQNFENDMEYEFEITDYLGSAGLFPDGIHTTYIKTDLGEEEKLRQRALEIITLHELGATPEVTELEATPEVKAQIPELENLFLEEIPASPEELRDFILKSDYVEEIATENEVAKVETDDILLEALQATPEVLEEVAATPDLNFIFIPSATVNFPAQTFSFTEDRVTSISLGELIFVQNKEEVWNTFVGVTDFELLSGDHVIGADALTVVPGPATVLSEMDGADIDPGSIKRLKSSTDRVQLVNVNPESSTAPEEDKEPEIFVMKPTLQVQIPAGTPAGTYRATLTITTL